MAGHSFTPQLVIPKLRATAMIFVADFEFTLVAVAANVTAAAILVIVVAEDVAVNTTVIMLAAVFNTAIKAATASFIIFIAAA